MPTRQPRFAGYVALKAALDADVLYADGIDISTVYMPLVATKRVQSKGRHP